MHGLERATLKPPSLIDRLLRRQPKENAALELNNLFAATPLLAITRKDIVQLLKSYGHSLEDAKPALTLLYTQILKHFSSDRAINEDEQRQLEHIRDIATLTPEEVREIENQVLLPIYELTLSTMVSDMDLSEAEREQLEVLAEDLRLDRQSARTSYLQVGHGFIQQALERAVNDRRLSPAEEAELHALSSSMGIKMQYDHATLEALERFRLLHRISQGELPVFDVPIRLQRGEICHAYVGANHYERRTVTKAVRYGGVSTRVRIMKGVYLHGGQVHTQRVTQDVMKLLDQGTLYFTNKRLLFNGANKTTQIPLKKIIDFTAYQDGLLVEKDSGKDQIFEFQGDAELLGTVMEMILQQSRL